MNGPSSLVSGRESVQVVLLCGGLGTRRREERELRPRRLVETGGRPLLWHAGKLYAAHGLGEGIR